jgi:hypothetical protein
MVKSLIKHRDCVASCFRELRACIVSSVTDVYYCEPQSVFHFFGRIAIHVLTEAIDGDLSVGWRKHFCVHRKETSE